MPTENPTANEGPSVTGIAEVRGPERRHPPWCRPTETQGYKGRNRTAPARRPGLSAILRRVSRSVRVRDERRAGTPGRAGEVDARCTLDAIFPARASSDGSCATSVGAGERGVARRRRTRTAAARRAARRAGGSSTRVEARAERAGDAAPPSTSSHPTPAASSVSSSAVATAAFASCSSRTSSCVRYTSRSRPRRSPDTCSARTSPR